MHKYLFYNKFIICIYVFRAICANHLEVDIVQGVLKRALQLWKRLEIYTEDIHNVLNCQNVGKHTEFYLG